MDRAQADRLAEAPVAPLYFLEGEVEMPNQYLLCTRLFFVTAFLVVKLGTTYTALAAEDKNYPSAENGYELAGKVCKTCHLIDGSSVDSAPAGPPPFSWIANKPGQTADRIKGSLLLPHPPMPDMHLSNDEIMDIIAYLDTLRSDESAPPFLPPPGDPKPKYPSPT